MGKVYLDPNLKDIVLPVNKRGDSSGSTKQMTKGSRYKMPEAGEVMRLFVHWTGQDVDLSAVFLDDYLNCLQQISFTKLAGWSAIHSGDVRYAPNGASEFIDFNINDMINRNVRYVVASLISFAGGNFESFPCYTGVMTRDSLKSGKKFEPASVDVKFDVTTGSTNALPIILDIQERKIIYADIASSGRSFQTVTSTQDKLVAQTKAILELADKKPTAWDVLYQHARVRGTIVNNIEEADKAFLVGNVDLESVLEMTNIESVSPNTDYENHKNTLKM